MVLKHNGKIIASQVEFARNMFTQALGLMFRKSIPHDFALIFTLKKPKTVDVHMLCMRFPIDAIFLDNQKKIIGTASLTPWVGRKHMKGVQYLIEMNRGTVETYGLAVGDTVRFDD